jgi:hypothetical protein
MHTVCTPPSFLRAAYEAGMSEEELQDLINFLSLYPTAGDEIPGTGGCRKLRVAGKGKGKSGGFRAITFYSGELVPVYLITVFAKGERSDLSQRERNGLRDIAAEIATEARAKVVKARKQTTQR